MNNAYPGTTTRFLRDDERLIVSEEKEMPLVIEACEDRSKEGLQTLLSTYSHQLLNDIATYGAVLLRGFAIESDDDFEKTILSIKGFSAISDAFMSEEGRIHPNDLKYVLYTNAVYKTGGTLYLGGFHTENYYSADVPAYITFCCHKPSTTGGETGLINMEKIYENLDQTLKQRLEKNSYFVANWLVSDVAKRYKLSEAKIESLCKQFDLPIVGSGQHKMILMYKPSVAKHPITQKPALMINLFEIQRLNAELRACFMADYAGKTWFWHRFIWRLPAGIFKVIEKIYVMFASFFYSPNQSLDIFRSKIQTVRAKKMNKDYIAANKAKVGDCFTDNNVKELAKLMRNYYCSCLWKKGDILLVDNRKVAHAGMPGAGPRLVRAIIGSPLEMRYSWVQPGSIDCNNRTEESLGFQLSAFLN